MLTVQMAAVSEIGGRRSNEDELRHGTNRPFAYAVLADGAGGHRGGAIAAELAVRATARGLQSAPALTPRYLTQLVHDTHAALCDQQHGCVGRDRMHTTLVALWIDAARGEALWTHVGDSRLYMLRHGLVCAMTSDDSVVQRLLAAGHVTPKKARNHPLRHQLLSALGTLDPISPHTLKAAVALSDGDAFLLCSDGWWEAFDPADIERMLVTATSAQHWLDSMAAHLGRHAHPGQDNYSAVAVWLSGSPDQPAAGGLPED